MSYLELLYELLYELPYIIEHNGKRYSIDRLRLQIKHIDGSLSIFLKNSAGNHIINVHSWDENRPKFDRYKYQYSVTSSCDYSFRDQDEIDIIQLGFKIIEIINLNFTED